MRGSKQIQQFARQLFKLSLVDGRLTADQVAGVLQYLEKHPPARPLPVLRAYRRLIAAEFARGRALVDHAGPVADGILQSIEGAMSQRYHRPITVVARPDASLLAGLRIRVGDDVYESSAAGQLATLSI